MSLTVREIFTLESKKLKKSTFGYTLNSVGIFTLMVFKGEVCQSLFIASSSSRVNTYENKVLRLRWFRLLNVSLVDHQRYYTYCTTDKQWVYLILLINPYHTTRPIILSLFKRP